MSARWLLNRTSPPGRAWALQGVVNGVLVGVALAFNPWFSLAAAVNFGVIVTLWIVKWPEPSFRLEGGGA